jgi:hypothetical protein
LQRSGSSVLFPVQFKTGQVHIRLELANGGFDLDIDTGPVSWPFLAGDDDSAKSTVACQ